MREQMVARCDHIEEAYEFMLAYAAQGDLERAEANLQVAVNRNNFFTDAQAALEQVRRGLVPALPPRHYLS